MSGGASPVLGLAKQKATTQVEQWASRARKAAKKIGEVIPRVGTGSYSHWWEGGRSEGPLTFQYGFFHAANQAFHVRTFLCRHSFASHFTLWCIGTVPRKGVPICAYVFHVVCALCMWCAFIIGCACAPLWCAPCVCGSWLKSFSKKIHSFLRFGFHQVYS